MISTPLGMHTVYEQVRVRAGLNYGPVGEEC